MRPNPRPFPGPTPVCFALLATLVFAALQNITVDDAVLVGPVVPAYLPSPSDWNIGNNCSTCSVHPNASLAYNGTWHDCTFYPQTSTYTQEIEFTFIGSGLYIFFILANTVPTDTNTLVTYVNFTLDGVDAGSFEHSPTTSLDFDYNQAVYANNSLPDGQHTMIVAPINDTSDGHILILFDYLIYTTDTNATITGSGSPTSSQTSSPTSPGSATTPSGSNTGAIVGGAVGGAAALVLAISILCYRRYKRRTAGQSPPPIMTAVEPFTSSGEMAPMPTQGIILPIQRIPIGSPLTESQSKYQPTASASSGATQPLSAPSSSTEATQPLNNSSDPVQSSNAFPHNAAAEILEQVGILRSEVSRLRRHQDMGWDASEVGSEPPPEYT